MENKKAKIAVLAAKLEYARDTVTPIDAITEEAPELDIDDAYAVQLINVEKTVLMGIQISGKKIGLTSLAMQEQMGVNEPDYGHLFENMYRKDGNIPVDKLLQPKAEAELAFVLKSDIAGPGATVEDVLAATDYVTPAIEIVDSRIRDWKIKLIDTVSDNASSGYYVLGTEKIPAGAVNLPEVSMSLYKNGEKVNEGSGAAVLENPAFCVAWLANKLWKYGVTLKAGEVVLSGALSAAVPAQKGDVVEARFSLPFGSVSAAFS